MENVVTIALSRLVAQTRDLDVIATNIANAATPGFRAERTRFAVWLAREPLGAEPPGGGPIDYAQDQATYRDATPGPRKVTGNPLDIAIGDPAGWFTVNTARGPRLTRDGRFQLDANGTVVDAAGNPVLDVNGRPLQVAPTDTRLSIAADGTISSQNGPIGRIGIVQPADPDRMTAEGGSLFAADTPTSPLATPQLMQGTIEDSNVQPIREITTMMQQLRQFQLTAEMIQAEHDREMSAIDKILVHPQG
jgi:flagellar basal-body rod protein FlgF